MRKADLLKSLRKLYDAIKIYHRVKHLLNERIENVHKQSDLSEEDSMVHEKEMELYNKTQNALSATINLKNQFLKVGILGLACGPIGSHSSSVSNFTFPVVNSNPFTFPKGPIYSSILSLAPFLDISFHFV